MRRYIYILLTLFLIAVTVSCSKTEKRPVPASDSTSAVDSGSESVTDSETEPAEESLSIDYDWGITIPEDLELGGYWVGEGETRLLWIDESNPLFCLGELSQEVTLSDGTAGTSTIRLPYIDLDLDYARTVSNHIYHDYSEKYSEYFNSPDDRIVNVDYSYKIAQDTLCILMTERIQTPESVSEMTFVYYYDFLANNEMSMVEFLGVCGVDFTELLDGLHETEWASQYLDEVGALPDDTAITALTFNKAESEEEVDTFDVYCINPDKLTQTVVNVTPIEIEYDLSSGNLIYY